ncbi:MAG: LysE family transporter [Acidimicrobiia bacterium]
MEAFFAGALAGYGIAIPVGAIALLIVQVGIKCGFRCAWSAGAGAATADLLYAGLAVVGGAAVAQVIESAGDGFRIASGLVLVGIAAWGLRSASKPVVAAEVAMPSRSELAGTYARFLGLTAINPMTMVYFAAVVVGFGVSSGLSATGAVLFCIGAFLASLSWQTALAAVGATAGKRMTPRVQTIAMVLGNLLVLAIAIVILIP